MATRQPYTATDTTEPRGSAGVGVALEAAAAGGDADAAGAVAEASEDGVGEEAPVPTHGAAGVPVGAYVGAIARRVLSRYAWWLAVPVAVAFGGFYDWRYAVIALMLLLLVFPMVVTIAVFNHGMHPAVVRRTRAETVELTALATATTGAASSSPALAEDEPSPAADASPAPSPSSPSANDDSELTLRDADGAVILTIPLRQIRRVHTAAGRTTITFGPTPADILILPTPSLPQTFFLLNHWQPNE